MLLLQQASLCGYDEMNKNTVYRIWITNAIGYNNPKHKKLFELYSDIEEWYEEFLQTEQAKECIAGFDAALPEYAWLSDIKKVDSILWSIR